MPCQKGHEVPAWVSELALDIGATALPFSLFQQSVGSERGRIDQGLWGTGGTDANDRGQRGCLPGNFTE
ncbi:MAG: hypothetical protein JWL90_2919 [Chthoniobacteraceae bacterium]|nr:hypothetical protein [Chthoniobacteraceae bacterium]